MFSFSQLTLQFAQTIIDQGHLCPLPLNIRPIYWAYDHALRLYPVPDMVHLYTPFLRLIDQIFLGDSYSPFCMEHAGSKVTNSGSFSRNDYKFMVYSPSTKLCQERYVFYMLNSMSFIWQSNSWMIMSFSATFISAWISRDINTYGCLHALIESLKLACTRIFLDLVKMETHALSILGSLVISAVNRK